MSTGTALARSSIAMTVLRLSICRSSPKIATRSSQDRCQSMPCVVAGSRMSLRASSSSSQQAPPYTLKASSESSSDPLAPDIPVSALGLPLHPLPLPPRSAPAPPMTREALHRLHRLSALNPPAPDSQEETELLKELGELIGLMDVVKEVEMDIAQGYGDLLGRGVGELVLDFRETKGVAVEEKGSITGEDEAGKEKKLLKYATRRVGDFYASRLPRKTG